MTSPATPLSGAVGERWWLRPRLVLPVVTLMIILTVLLAPHDDADPGMEMRLTTYSAGPTGARGIYDVLARLGWQVSRRTTRLDSALDTGAVYAILAPPIPLDSTERLAVESMVRRGGRVLLVSQDSEFTIPFGLYPSYAPTQVVPIAQTSAAGDRGNVIHRDQANASQFPQLMREAWKLHTVVQAHPPINDALAVLLWASSDRGDSTTAPALMLGRQVGRGRVVLIGEQTLLWNVTVQEGHSALAIQRAIEWLAPSNRQVIFDEYHQGTQNAPGTGPDMPGAIGDALTHTAFGRAGLQGIAAVLVLLIALGVRPIPPRPVRVIQRRSLLEHVDALGRAYQQIHASQFGTAQLIRGLRRRHPTGAAVARWTSASDADYLAAIQQRYGTAQRDVDTITRALHDPSVTPASVATSHKAHDDLFLQAGQAIGRIEHSIHVQ